MRPRYRELGDNEPVRRSNVIKITSTASIAVRKEPLRTSVIMARMQEGFIVVVYEEKICEEVTWFRLNSGWMCSRDSAGIVCYVDSNDIEGQKFWVLEFEIRRRFSSAITQMLTESYSLPNARKITKILVGKAKNYMDAAINVPEITTEDLLIGIASSTGTGLDSAELFEFMKVAASKQSDPAAALKGIAEDLHKLMALRPTLWVKQNLGILNTETLMIKNNQFVMACARDDTAMIQKFLANGQELIALHSEMKYTGLHASADFGSKNAMRLLLNTGIPPNIRDARFGQTALHFAAQSGRAEMISILLEFGADRAIMNMKGELPLEVANEHGYILCREMLKDPPPPILLASIDHATSHSITISWQPPQINRAQHALVEEYMIVHEAVELNSKKDASVSEIDERWSPVLGFKNREGSRLIRTTSTKLEVRDLAPASGHSFILMSRSAGGWSKPSSKLVHFTHPSVPSEPTRVELLKVNKNGLIISWHPPLFDNGCKIQLYQIEMSDREPDWNLDEGSGDDSVSLGGQSQSDASTGTYSVSQASSSIVSLTNEPVVLDGQWHRIIKHRQVEFCEKYLAGLETDRKYYFRCCAKNEVGWGNWGYWAGPYTPGNGVRVDAFGDMCLTLRWVAPVLVNREVTAYEVQMCQPSGPRQNSIDVFHRKKVGAEFAESQASLVESKAEGYEYFTVTDSLVDNEAFIENLKPGVRYQFRVRPQIENVWCDWAIGQNSDIIAVPASAPDRPTNVVVGSLTPTLFRSKQSDYIGEETNILENVQKENENESEPRKTSDDLASDEVSTYYSKAMGEPAVNHNSILITWSNGLPNGSPILENAVEFAKIRDYNHQDTALSLDAAGKLGDTNTEYIKNGEIMWENALENGKYIASTALRVRNLTPENGYIFRVRQRNTAGWSEWSLSSAVITTLAAAPPTPPEAVTVGSYYAILEWNIIGGEFGYTILDYELHVALLPTGKQLDPKKQDADDSSWDIPLEWAVPETRRADIEPDESSLRAGSKINKNSQSISQDNFNCKRVFVDKLLPMSYYVSRIKVRTVTGWSGWSGIGAPFRTLSS